MNNEQDTISIGGREPLILATRQDHPAGDDRHNRAVGAHGPAVLGNCDLPANISPFERERIPERVAHARAAGAHGYFEAYGSVGDETASRYTRAGLFQQKGKRTPLFARFSTVIHGGHSPETLRDPRGFALKFYTEDGNWDLVGTNLQVSFIRDATRLPHVVRAFKPDPFTNRQDPQRIFDLVSLNPSMLHMVTWLFSPWGLPANYREMRGSGVHAYRWVNDDGDAVLVKYHFQPKIGERNLTQAQADAIQATNFNHATQDLYDAIERGDFPEWEMSVQVMDEGGHPELDFDPLDPTKIWPPGQFPLLPVGRIVLDRNPKNYFAEVEQVAFGTGTLVDGLDLSDDMPLQARAFCRSDTQRYRVESDCMRLPPGLSDMRAAADLRDARIGRDVEGVEADRNADIIDTPAGGRGPGPTGIRREVLAPPAQGALLRLALDRGDEYGQAGERYRKFEDWERDELVRNLVGALAECGQDIQQRMIEHFRRCDEEYGLRVAEGLASCSGITSPVKLAEARA